LTFDLELAHQTVELVEKKSIVMQFYVDNPNSIKVISKTKSKNPEFQMPIKCAKIEHISKTLYFLDHLTDVFMGVSLANGL
jgi:hypothetical protein